MVKDSHPVSGLGMQFYRLNRQVYRVRVACCRIYINLSALIIIVETASSCCHYCNQHSSYYHISAYHMSRYFKLSILASGSRILFKLIKQSAFLFLFFLFPLFLFFFFFFFLLLLFSSSSFSPSFPFSLFLFPSLLLPLPFLFF